MCQPTLSSFSGSSRPDADVHIESLYRACCHLVPFGRSGSRGGKHSALRGLVYVSRGRCCPRRACHSRCNCDSAVIALRPLTRQQKRLDRRLPKAMRLLCGYAAQSMSAKAKALGRGVQSRPRASFTQEPWGGSLDESPELVVHTGTEDVVIELDVDR